MNGINSILLIYAVGLHSAVGMIHKAIKPFFAATVPQYKLSLQRAKKAVCLFRTVITSLLSSSGKANAIVEGGVPLPCDYLNLVVNINE